MLRDSGKNWEVVELELDPPKGNELLVKWVASGLCHSDEHLRHGDIVPRFPIVGGHEGAGIVEEVGPGVIGWEKGDHVVASFLPACGHCRWCSTGRSNICDSGATILEGCMTDGSFRFHDNGSDVGAMCMLGTFSQYGVISTQSAVKVDKELPLDKVCLVGCGVATGWGTAVYSAPTEVGDTIAIFGIGGIGINAVQGAKHAGATNIIAIDPLANKREMAEQMGATHSVSNAEEATALAQELTRGVGADKALVTVDVVTPEITEAAVNIIRKGGRVVLTALADPAKATVQVSGSVLTLFEKEIVGRLFGGGNPHNEIPKLLNLYTSGQLKLDELITKTYTLDQINDGYNDLIEGKNVRGVLIHEH